MQGRRHGPAPPAGSVDKTKMGSSWPSRPGLHQPQPGLPAFWEVQAFSLGDPTSSHRECGPSSNQSIDEGRGCSAGSLRPGVRLGISAVIAEEALGVHREGVRELQAVSKKDHDAQQHRLQPVRGQREAKRNRRRSEAVRSESETRKWKEMEEREIGR